MKTIHVDYNIFGYKTYISGEDEPIAEGGNSNYCSETVLRPLYVGETAHHQNIPLKLAQIKELAQASLREQLTLHPGAVTGGTFHDRDGQDEYLAMMGMGDHPSASKRLKAETKRKLARLLAPRPELDNLTKQIKEFS